MNSSDRIKSLCKERKIPVSRLEKELGFANGYVGQKKKEFPIDRLRKIAEFFDVSVDYLTDGVEEVCQIGTKKDLDMMTKSIMKSFDAPYYTNQETADMAQELFDNKDMRILFDAARGSDPDDLRMAADFLKRLKNKERGEN